MNEKISKIIWKAFEKHATLHHEGDPADVEMVEDMTYRITELIEGRQCMYCEKQLKPGEAIVLCKECTQ